MNETESFASRLICSMADQGLNQLKLSDKMGVSPSSVSRWMTEGEGGSIPRNAKLNNLASILKVTASWLLTGEGDKEPVNKKAVEDLKSDGVLTDEAFVTVPVLSWAHAGQAMTYEQMPEDYLEPMIVPADLARRNKVVGFIVDGDSMEPEICPHDHIALLPDEEPRQGCVVVAKFKEDESVMIRRYQIMETDKGKPVRVRMIPRNDFYAASEHHINEFESIIPVGAVARKLF